MSRAFLLDRMTGISSAVIVSSIVSSTEEGITVKSSVIFLISYMRLGDADARITVTATSLNLF